MADTSPQHQRLQQRGLLQVDRLGFRQIEAHYKRMESRAAEHRTDLERTFGAPLEALPAQVFLGMQDLMATAAELVNGLVRSWDETEVAGPQSYHDQIRLERGRYVMTLGRMTYVELLSLIEFCVTHAIQSLPTLFPPLKGKAKIYLHKVFSDSAAIGWMPASHAEAWKGLTELRNAVVHRNGISDKNAKYAITGTVGLQFATGARITDTADLFPTLCDWAIEATYMWSVSYLQSARPQGWSSLYVP